MSIEPFARAALAADRLVAGCLLALVRLYKVAISPFFTGSCRFLPSCSDYAREAVATHGAVRGSFLAAGRLCRCHPFCAGGYDPVPAFAPRSPSRTSAGAPADCVHGLDR